MNSIKTQVSLSFAILLFIWLTPSTVSAQTDATPILRNLIDKYEKVTTLTSEIRISIQFPEQDPVVQKAVIYQKGKKFRVDADQQIIVSDGKTIWTYTPEDNRVVLTYAEEGNEGMNFSSPHAMLKELVNKSELMWVTEHIKEGKRTVSVIELKPKDKNEEFFKIKLHVYEPKLLLTQLQSFSKDGTRYTLWIDKSTTNPKIEEDKFVFDPKKYPGIEVEDLRI